MTEKRFIVSNHNWITDNYIEKLLNIDFNTIIDANLCCNLLNQLEDEKKRNGKIASRYLEENEELKSALKELKEIDDYYEMRIKELSDENQELQMYKDSVSDVLLSWSQKNLTAKQLQVVIAIMEELNVKVN